MLVHRRNQSPAKVERLANAIWYPIWDLGLGLDHSVKTPKQALEVATSDVRAMLGLLDARVVAGDFDLGTQALSGVSLYFARHLRAVARDVYTSSVGRYRDFGELAYLLEPNLKESNGGLRDVHIVRSFMAVSEFVGLPNAATIGGAADFLLDLRVELHRLTQKPVDRLGLEEQDALAPLLGFASAEALMKELSRNGRAIAFALKQILRTLEADGSERRTSSSRGTISGFGESKFPVRIHQGTLGFETDEPVDVLAIVRLARRCAREGWQLRRGEVPLAQRVVAPIVPWPEELRDEFVSLLQSGEGLIEVMEALDTEGVLEILIPEWAEVSCKPQRNAFHRYSVDRHLLEAVVGAARIRRRVHRPDLLVVGALFHDIGKGRSGDHTDNGIAMVSEISKRMGFSELDQEMLVRLTHHHLLLAETAMRRDVSDPSIVAMVAAAVGGVDALELLFALTEADSKATGTLAWTKWKESLIGELVERAAAYLDHGSMIESGPRIDPTMLSELIESGAKGAAVATRDGFVYVGAPDRRGLFSLVAGAMSLAGISIVSAEVFAMNGVAIERFRVVASHGGDPNLERFKSELSKAMSKPHQVAPRLDERASSMRQRRRSAPLADQLPPRVVVDNSESQRATIVEISAPNRLGLLYEVTSIFASHELDITHAKVMTRGDDVIDAFYLTDGNGSQITDPALLSELYETVYAVVAREK